MSNNSIKAALVDVGDLMGENDRLALELSTLRSAAQRVVAECEKSYELKDNTLHDAIHALKEKFK